MSSKNSKRVYFPEFHGVITDFGISKFTLNTLGFLSVFEVEYYHNLFHDRIRRLLVLHRLGITHVTPYLINFRPPRALKDISDSEQDMVKQQVYKRCWVWPNRLIVTWEYVRLTGPERMDDVSSTVAPPTRSRIFYHFDHQPSAVNSPQHHEWPTLPP
ncbi:hypothetical protein P170DRAFT_426061 [Aspergillus steynii IBT 23096]|uniref:Uncharacterized protein n=1 Tax=Aspergillus steynii IBT 23096 TaxID=1392250 RepID=A0A2I2G878_9EURO|nr:uncharacterized protein P170DRAFT_426061 [Aspergillus steynii IBT 23096]PLB49082.1 hypothetical protein P170DRAFT_426061 [Aspergillus steynii IBT 23096]